MTIKSFCGDSLQIPCPPQKLRVDNLKVIDCTFEENRRQGISFVGAGDNYLIKNCNIGKIQGTDPQSGIDVEVEASEPLKHLCIDNCNFYDNKKFDICLFNGDTMEVKNSTFNGTLAENYGKNTYIHDNRFVFYDNPQVDKCHKGWGYSPSGDVDGYAIVTNNYFEGYNSSFGVQSKRTDTSYFANNTLVNCLCVIFGKAFNNTYRNSVVHYKLINYPYSNESIYDSEFRGDIDTKVPIDKDKDCILFKNSIINNSRFTGTQNKFKETIFDDCEFYFNNKTFINGGSDGNYTIKNSNIVTEYKTYKWDNPNNSFIFSNVGIGIITNCNFNVSCTTLIRVNYNEIYFNNNNITFNQSYIGDNVGYTLGGTEILNNKFYKNFDTPTVQLFVTGTNYINDVEFSDTIIV